MVSLCKYTDSTGNKLLYDPTGLNDALVAPTIIPYASTGAPATEADINTEKTNLQVLYAELNKLKQEQDTKDKELFTNQEKLRIKERSLIRLRNDEKVFQEKLTKVQTLLPSSTFLATSPGADK